jgi:PAS domain S-box-containing protein
MSPASYTLILLTAIVAVLVAVLVFAVLRFIAAARDVRARGGHADPAPMLMAAAIEQALAKLKEQERAQHARAELSERLSDQIIAGITSGLLVVERSGVVRLVNPAGARLLGLTQDVAGKPVRDVLANAVPLAEVIEEGVKTGRALSRRTVTLQGSGSGAVVHLGVTVSPALADQPAGHVICLFTDLTEVLAREDQLRLRESLARLGELTAGLAHEFRNGLATIHGYGRMLNPATLPPEAGRYVEGIRQETDALGEVVTNFLAFAKPTPLAVAPVDLGAIVERVAAERRSEVEKLRGTLDVAGEFGTVEGDDVLLRQAFDNLCRNAIEACEAAGRAPAIRFTGRRGSSADPEVVVTVTDNGPGIDAKALPRIFQPFVTTRARGTGLGLALVQKIVVTHNGRITASNSPGGGAAFEVRLPLADAPLTNA